MKRPKKHPLLLVLLVLLLLPVLAFAAEKTLKLDQTTTERNTLENENTATHNPRRQVKKRPSPP